MSSNAAVAALAYLRQQSLPRLIDPPVFVPRTRQPSQPEAIDRLLGWLSREALLVALLLTAVIAVATAVPAWASFGGSASVSAPRFVITSSPGTTGSVASRVKDFGAGTFVGQIPFLQQSRYLSALRGDGSDAQRFVQGAREAGVARYVQDVEVQAGLPYLADAAERHQAVKAWSQALEQARRQAELQAAAPLSVPVPATFRAPALGSGMIVPGVRITYYACIGNGFCGTMASGIPAFEGAAACSWDLPLGTRFVIAGDPTGRVYACLDRGALATNWVDIWFYHTADGAAWQSMVGAVGDITIVP